MNNTFQGLGIYYFSNQRIYIGEWKNKKKHGYGEFIWPEKKYIGFYVNDKKEGFGITAWKNGNKAVIGFWKEGKQLGFGKIMNKKNEYFGIWNYNNKVDLFKTKEDGIKFIEKNEIKKYKKFFEFDLDEIIDYCYKDDDIEKVL